MCIERMVQRTGRGGRKGGFTLVELLVVISIIAVLLTVLIPALRVAREQASGAVCLVNQRSLLQGWIMYADENNGNLVGADNNWSGWVVQPLALDGTPISTWTTINGITVSGATLEDKKRGIMAGRLWKYVENLDVYNCPGDRRRLNSQQRTFRTYSISTAMNSAYGYTTGVQKMGAIKMPENVYAFVEEADMRGWNLNSWAVNPIDSPDKDWWVDELAIWHNKASTLGFVDGHAEMHKWADERTIEIMASGNKWDKLFSPDNDDLHYMQEHYGVRSNHTK